MPNEDTKSTLELLRKLQESLLEVNRLEKEISQTPEKVEALNEETEERKKAADDADQTLKDERLNSTRLDGELKSQQEQLSTKTQQTLAVKTNDQLWAIQKEIKFIEENISEIEMKIIQSMEDSDDLESKLQDAKKAFSGAKAENDKKIADLEKLLKLMEGEIVEEQKTFSDLSQEIPQQYAILLKRIQNKLQGTAMTELEDGTCNSCHVRIRPQMALEVRMGKAIHQCPNCARILFSMADKAKEAVEE